ncbi:MAG: hypothetical protein FWF44_07430 [Defluviitaleaceae bacterium]|nr:hypothetical protein [Defluviitaleaceae bacterium]
MTTRENFRKAVFMDNPSHVPLNGCYCHGRYDEASECKVIDYRCGDADWGYHFSRLDSDKHTMGQVTEHPLMNHKDIADWQPPALDGENRFGGVAELVREYKDGDFFTFGQIGSFIFERMHYLAGMEEIFVLMCEEPKLFRAFGDKITDYNCRVIREFAAAGADGVWGGDDWGMQDRLMIAPGMWREFFKPWYAKLFRTAKELGLVTYMHSCGKNNAIISDLIECGLDIIELHQPDVYGVDWLSEYAGGKICFSTTPDIQTVMPCADEERLVDEIANLKEKLGRFNGGLIYDFYGNPAAIGASEANMSLYLDKAREIGKYL